MSCKGPNCTASKANGYNHSSECLFEYAANRASGVVSASCGVELPDGIDHVVWCGKVIDLASTPAAPGIDLAPRPMATAPRDGTMLRLLVQFDDHATEDTKEPAWTIGHCSKPHPDDDDNWQFAGWCWDHDHFTEGKGTPVGWLPLIDPSPKGGSIDNIVRAAFQSWAVSQNMPIYRKKVHIGMAGDYADSWTESAWAAWQAAVQATSVEVGK